eukprot:2168286-Pleurochrysis_carterae.AAC.1
MLPSNSRARCACVRAKRVLAARSRLVEGEDLLDRAGGRVPDHRRLVDGAAQQILQAQGARTRAPTRPHTHTHTHIQERGRDRGLGGGCRVGRGSGCRESERATSE